MIVAAQIAPVVKLPVEGVMMLTQLYQLLPYLMTVLLALHGMAISSLGTHSLQALA